MLGKRGRSNIWFMVLMVMASCSDDAPDPIDNGNDSKVDSVGNIPEVIASDVNIVMRATKISQLVGDMDREKDEPTQNMTNTRYGLQATDLGVPFQDGDTTYILFGDSWGIVPGLPNVMAYTTDNTPEDGLGLDFIEDNSGYFHPLSVPEISQHAFEVPTEGVMVNGKMYIYHTTDHNPPFATMGRSILARGNDDGGKTFKFLYNMSTRSFINVSLVQVEASDWEFLPEEKGKGHVIFGSGRYRESHVYLAYQPAAEIENPETIRYFMGVDETGIPLWSNSEKNSQPLFELDNPCVGEFSVSYNKFIDRWILLYNCGNPRGINMRTAKSPWGPWTESQLVFHPWDDGGYCHFIHASYESRECDNVHDVGREKVWGGEYGPYQFEHFATGDSQSTTIYFTMSTWNPYTVVLMKAGLQREN